MKRRYVLWMSLSVISFILNNGLYAWTIQRVEWGWDAPGVTVTDPPVWGNRGMIVTDPLHANIVPGHPFVPACTVIQQCDADGNCIQQQVCN